MSLRVEASSLCNWSDSRDFISVLQLTIRQFTASMWLIYSSVYFVAVPGAHLGGFEMKGNRKGLGNWGRTDCRGYICVEK